MIATACFLAVALSSAVAYAIGHRFGFDAGWCNRHFQQIHKDNARRASRLRHSDGTFRAKG